MEERIINGKAIGFCFNFYAFGIAEENLNMPIDEILKSLSDKKKGKIKVISALFYAGAVNYNEIKGRAIDFKINDVGDWLEEIGFNEAMEILTKAVSILRPKNIQPPQTEGVEKVGELVNT